MKTMSTLNHHHHHHHRPPSHLTTVGGKGDAVSKKELDVFNVARRRRMTTTRRQCCATKTTTTTTTRRTEAYYYSSLLVVFDNGRKRNATKVRAYARDYPTYDELGDGFNRGVGGWRDKHPADGTGNAEKDFFFADQISQQQQQQQQPERGHQQHHHHRSSSSVAVSSTLSSAARDWFETCFGLLKMTVPLTAACACVAAASMDSARYTMSGQVYSLATGMTTGGVIISGFAVLASVISGFFVATSAFADFGGTSMSSANKRRKGKKNNNAASRQQQQQQQQQNTMGYEQQGYVDPSYEQQKYQQQQQQHRRQPVERYDPPIVYPTRPPSSPSKRAAREAYDAWTPEVPIVDPRAQIPRPSDVDYYSSSRRTGGSKDTQPDWDKNESWGSYKSPGQRRRELGYEFKGTDALKNYVDPRDQYERRVSNHSPEAEYIYNQHNIRSNDELRAPRHDINNYTNTIPERDRLIPKPMERPKPGYIPTEVLIAMGGASLSSHIKTKVEDGSIREMRRQKEEFNKKKESNATNMFGEKVNTNNMFRRGS